MFYVALVNVMLSVPEPYRGLIVFPPIDGLNVGRLGFESLPVGLEGLRFKDLV